MNLAFQQTVIKDLSTDGLRLQVTKNEANGRIYVEFSTEDGKLRLQKNFEDNHEGRKASESFEKTIKNLNALKKYFGLNKKEKKNVAKSNSGADQSESGLRKRGRRKRTN